LTNFAGLTKYRAIPGGRIRSAGRTQQIREGDMSELIEVDGLSKRFGDITAADGISFKVKRGEVLGFLGPNGAGKSTTMKMITGFLQPTSGTARVCGHDVLSDPLAAKARIGYLPEGAPLYGEMTVLDFLDFVAGMRGLRGQEAEAAVDRAIAKLELEGVVFQRTETLSKGFKRRVGLAQAILHDPDVLILDEPTDGLDPNQKHQVRKLIREMAETKAIVISTHILEEVDAVCRRCVVIARGKVVADATPDELAAMSDYHNAVRLRLPADQARRATEKLRALPHISHVEQGEIEAGAIQLRALSSGKRPIIEDVAKLLRTEGFDISALSVERGHLDEVFRRLTQPATAARERDEENLALAEADAAPADSGPDIGEEEDEDALNRIFEFTDDADEETGKPKSEESSSNA
jgi:ABC-2 type transport system ATP-binding protein